MSTWKVLIADGHNFRGVFDDWRDHGAASGGAQSIAKRTKSKAREGICRIPVPPFVDIVKAGQLACLMRWLRLVSGFSLVVLKHPPSTATSLRLPNLEVSAMTKRPQGASGGQLCHSFVT
jgi:hypothetical protein